MCLLPDVIAEKVTDLTPEFLKSRKIEFLMLDFDNTLLPYTVNTPTSEVLRWLDGLKRAKIRLCVVSNSRKERVKVFCKQQNIPCITHARKPFSKGIRACLTEFGLALERCALVGDQIYTDVLGANSNKVQSILVKAIHNHTVWLKLRHVAELPWIALAKERRISK